MSERGFLCEKVWTAPDASNDLIKCLSSPIWLQAYLTAPERVVPLFVGVLCILTAVFILFIYPSFLIARYCCGCCGGAKPSPGGGCCPKEAEWSEKSDEQRDAMYSRSDIYCAKGCAIGVAIFTVGALILTLVGSSTTIASYNLAFANAKEILGWASNKTNYIQTRMTVPDANDVPVLVPPLTLQLFTDMNGTIGGYNTRLDNFKNEYAPYITNANIGAIIIATVPLAFIIMTVLAALFNIRGGVLVINSVFHLIVILAYGVIGGIFLILSVFIIDIDAERTKLLNNQSGLFTMMLIPQFDKEAPFANTKTQVSAGEIDNSIAACRNFLSMCDATSSSFNPAKPNVIFSCSGLTDPTSQCNKLTKVQAFADNMRMFADSPTFCSNISAANRARDCSMAICAKNCQDGTPKTNCKEAVANLRFASASVAAFAEAVEPLLSFYVIFTELMKVVSVIRIIGESLTESGVGLCLFCIAFTWNMFVLFRGTKRFLSLEASAAPADGKAVAPSNEPVAGTVVAPAEKPV